MFRKIKYILFMLLTLTLFVGLAGCNLNPAPYSFMHDVEEIQSIQIVHIELDYKYQDFTVDRIDDCKVLSEIEDISEFIERFSNEVLFKRYLLGDPTHLIHGHYAIKITYINGDFELIGYNAQCMGYRKSTSDGGSRYSGGYGVVFCNRDDFINFINSYLDEPIVY